MRFGIFDHMDDSGVPVGRQFEDRLALIEAYDRAGFHGYHLAEHHGTPLGYAPSPGLFLAAIAQRTSRLRFGPLVYLLPLYHPLRLIEEICMLDQMSGGRFLFGVGRGVSPIEVRFFGADPTEGAEQFAEALAVIRLGLTADRLTYRGAFYRFDRVPMVLKPVQQPHPPLWYGIANPDSTAWAAANDVNVVALRPAALVRQVTDRYRAEWQALGKPAEAIPLMGVARHIVIADSDDEAQDIAARAYPPWRHNMARLWDEYGVPFPLQAALPDAFAQLQQGGNAFAGTPQAAREYVAAQIAEAGVNYFVCDMAFGSMSLAEAARSVALFAEHVMPAFADRPA